MPSRPRGARKADATQPVTSGRATSRESGGMLHVRIADALKADAATTLAAIGLTTSEAVRLFLHRVVAEQRLPLDLEVPNDVTRAAIAEARSMAGRPSQFSTPDAMFQALEDPGKR